MMFIHFWGIVFVFTLHLLLHLFKYLLELSGIVLSLWAKRYSLSSRKLVFQTLPLITLLDKRIDIAAMAVENVWVETTFAADLRVDLVHKFLALFQTHINHQLLNCYQLTLIVGRFQFFNDAVFAFCRGAVVGTIRLILFVIGCFCTMACTCALLGIDSVLGCHWLLFDLRVLYLISEREIWLRRIVILSWVLRR